MHSTNSPVHRSFSSGRIKWQHPITPEFTLLDGHFYCSLDKGKQRALSVCVCNLAIPLGSASVPALVPPLCKWGVYASDVKWKYGKKSPPPFLKTLQSRQKTKWKICRSPWNALKTQNWFPFSEDAPYFRDNRRQHFSYTEPCNLYRGVAFLWNVLRPQGGTLARREKLCTQKFQFKGETAVMLRVMVSCFKFGWCKCKLILASASLAS